MVIASQWIKEALNKLVEAQPQLVIDDTKVEIKKRGELIYQYSNKTYFIVDYRGVLKYSTNYDIYSYVVEKNANKHFEYEKDDYIFVVEYTDLDGIANVCKFNKITGDRTHEGVKKLQIKQNSKGRYVQVGSNKIYGIV